MGKNGENLNDDEIFEDLNGNVDSDDLLGADGDDLDSQLLADAKADKDKAADKGEDDDLAIVDTDEDQPAADADDADEEQDEEEEAEPPVQEPTVDRRDIALLGEKSANVGLRIRYAKQDEADATAAIESALGRMKTAKEAGDTDGDIQATKDYTAALQKQARARDDLVALDQQDKAIIADFNKLTANLPKDPTTGRVILPPPNEGGQQRQQQPRVAPKQSKATQDFVANNAWFTDPKHKAKAEVLRSMDRALATEGKIKKGSTEYFTELSARFNRVYPGLVKDAAGRQVATGERKRGAGPSIPTGGGGGAPVRKVDAKKITLDSDDVKQMRKFGFDPQNREHRREWLTSKRQVAATTPAGRA